MWQVELCFKSSDDDAEVIREAINEFLLEYLETTPTDVPWAMITTHGLDEREARRWKPLLHSSRR